MEIIRDVSYVSTFVLFQFAALTGDSENIAVPMTIMALALAFGVMGITSDYVIGRKHDKQHHNYW